MGILKSVLDVFNLDKWTNDALVAKSTYIEPSTYRGGEEWFFSPVPGQYFTYKGHESSLTAYSKCPPLTAIINRKAQAYINGKTWIMNSQGKESQTPEAKKLRKLFSRPNPLQSWKQFEAQGYIYQQLFGYTIVLPIKPFGFKDNIDASSLWNVPPHMIEIKETNKLYYQSDTKGIIESITLNYKGIKTSLDVASIFILKDFMPSMNSLILPESRLRSLELPINNIIGAYESRNVLIRSRGPMYVMSSNKSDDNGNIPLTKTEKEQLQDDFKRRYGLSKGQSTAIITSANVKLDTIGYATKDLLLLEEVQESSIAVCNGFNYPPFLMGLKDSTFNNQNTAEKGLYQNSIIPDSQSIYEQWNQFFFGNTDDTNIIIQKDYDHLNILQDDELAKANARQSRNKALEIEFKYDLITLNRWLELNGEDTRLDGNVYFSDIKDKITVQNVNTQTGGASEDNAGAA